jgi:hypothetical protein
MRLKPNPLSEVVTSRLRFGGGRMRLSVALERDEEKWIPVFRPHPALSY